MRSPVLACILALISFASCDIQINSTDIIPDIVRLDNAVRTLTTATKSYTGGVLLSQGIDFAVVEAKLTKANADIGSLPQEDFDIPSIHALEDTVANTLAIDNPAAVDALIAKKSLIEQTPLQGNIVKGRLQSLLAGHLYFSQQALNRSPDSEKANVQSLADIITNALQRGIDAF